MTVRTYLLLLATLVPTAVAGACSTTVTVDPSSGNGNGGTGGFLFVTGGGGSGPASGGHPPDAGLPDADEPICKNQPPPIENFECDPYNQPGDCLPTEACYIYVNYPTEPCGQEEYGSFCYPQGSGGQGASCSGAFDCLAGHVCVITGSGTQCVQLCNLFGEDGCPQGLVCEAIDVEGFGGCL
jgi:hypothetical protein